MSKRVLITGGTGMIGSHLIKKLIERGDHVKILSRDMEKVHTIFKNHVNVKAIDSNKYIYPEQLSKIIEQTDIIINLAGANVGDKRWSEEYKNEIRNSRINITRLLVDSIRLSENKPELLISASGVGVYGFRGDEIITEDSKPGNDFLSKVCIDWEAEALKAEESGVRVSVIRTGIVLDKNDGALKELLIPFKFFAGVYQGDGKQWFSWIHIIDTVNLYLFVIENVNLKGAINGSSPDPVTNKELIKSISKFKKTIFTAPVPGFILKIAAGEFAENLLTGQRVIPEKAENAGFKFMFPQLSDALKDLFNKN